MKKYFFLLLFSGYCFAQTAPLPVRAGADVLLSDRYDIIKNKRVGLVANHSALLSTGKHLADTLHALNDVHLTVLFGPEHGIRGDAPDGKSIHDSLDQRTGIKVYSLYGRVTKPTPDMLRDVDVLLFDIQDVGARFYTFISTLFLSMEAAAENSVPFIVLDRPNPIRGTMVEGPIRDDSLKSFVGWAPIPITHGMTVGELALMANSQGWLKDGVKAKLEVVKMEQWNRSMWYDETSLRWIKPSPNMVTLQTAIVYPGSCLVEGTNVSEGRGSDKPFEYIGAPWIDGKKLAAELNSQKLPAVLFESVEFTPHALEKLTTDPKYREQRCHGVYIHVTDRNRFTPVATALTILCALQKQYPNDFQFRTRGFDRLAGTPKVRQMILDGASASEITATWSEQLARFQELRTSNLLYQ